MSNKIGNRNQESYLEKSSGFDAMSLSEKDAEIEFLRQQLELLKQELDCECQLTQAYRQELQDIESDLRRKEKELSTALLNLQMLELDRAKELAKSIVKSNKSVSESLAQLLSGIYNSTVEPGEFGQARSSKFRIKPSRRSDRMTARFVELEACLGEFKAQFGEFKAQFDKLKVSCATSQERDCMAEVLLSAKAE